MKKIIKVLIIAIVACLIFAGCNKQQKNIDNYTFDIVCTTFPQYDWVKNITKSSENVNVILLCDNGMDMHSFSPSAKDMIDVKTADMLIALGGISDKWVFDAVDENCEKASLVGLLGEKAVSEHLSGEYTFEDSEHEHDNNTENIDEHIWLSIENAQILTQKLCDMLCTANNENADIYKMNTEKYLNKLKSLDGEYKKAVQEASKNIIVVADRFPFVYLIKDYGIKAFAAFPGCSADTDASFETIIALSKKVDEYNLNCVAVTENSNGKTAQAVIDNTKSKNAKVIVLDSMQSVNMSDMESGTTYTSVMEENLQALKTLLA